MGAILLGYIFLMIDHLIPLKSDSNAIDSYDRDAFCYVVDKPMKLLLRYKCIFCVILKKMKPSCLSC